MPLKIQKLDLPWVVYCLAFLAFAVRLMARLHSGIAAFWVNSYAFFWSMAQGIAAGKGIVDGSGVPTAFRVPLYPIFLAALTMGHRLFWPIAITESMLGAGIVICAALLARSMFPGLAAGKIAVLAAAVTAVYPYYVIHDTALQETSLYTFLTLLSVIALRHTVRTERPASGGLAGLLLGLDVLTRATLAPFAVLMPLWLVWRKRPGGGAACALLLFVTLFPWVLRNYLLTGSPTLSTETGIQVWTGNNGYLFDHYPQESSDLSKDEAIEALPLGDRQALDRMGSDEAMRSRWFLHKAIAYISTHREQTAIDGVRKIAAGFSWLPSPRHGLFENLVYACTYGPVMLLGLWGMWRRRACWREDSLVYLLFATFIAITAVFWAHTDHRSYLDVYWIVFGAGAAVETIAGRTPRRPRVPEPVAAAL